MLHEDRRRARSFGADAARYDRARPDYPSAVLDAVGAKKGQEVLDVGCGTGIAGRLFARQGCVVLGVEPDPRMAAVARGAGLSVEISSFEEWDPRDRLFDVVASGQAWHWIDPYLGASKAAAVLRPAGRIALFWNCGHPEPDVKAAFDDIYRLIAPGVDSHSIVLGHHPDDRFDDATAAIDQTGLFGPVRRETHSWEKFYASEEWLDHLPTHSDHQGLPRPTGPTPRGRRQCDRPARRLVRRALRHHSPHRHQAGPTLIEPGTCSRRSPSNSSEASPCSAPSGPSSAARRATSAVLAPNYDPATVTQFVRPDGVEIDDDAARIDVEAVHRFLSEESYWAKGRDRATVQRLVRDATRVVGAYDDGRQVGFARCFSDRVSLAWVGDVYVERSHRGRRIGDDVVRFLIEGSDFSGVRWMLGTADAHSFYAKFGFGPPSDRILERPRAAGDPPGPPEVSAGRDGQKASSFSTQRTDP